MRCLIRRAIGLSLVSAVLLLPACAKTKIPEPASPPKAKDYWRQTNGPALRKITDPARLPNFRPAFASDKAPLLTAVNYSINYFKAPSSAKYFPVQDITHARAAASLTAFRDLLNTANSADEFHQRIIATFDVYESVGCDDEGTVLFTGYYTPIFDASLTPTAEFKYPLHRLPADLEKNPDGECRGRKLADGSVVPYYTRGEILDGALKGQELVYLKDPFEAYVCTIEGSVRLRLPDGSWFNIGYAGNNGKEYKSVGMLLIDAGLIKREELSLATLMAFFKRNPDKVAEYLPKNERYVFFQKTDAQPTGCLGLPVTPYRSIATDKSIFPRASLAFVDTRVPRASGDAPAQEPFQQFVLDQDAGSAIRAAGRSDLYLGIGDEAGRIAGWTFNEGRLYYLFLKQ